MSRILVPYAMSFASFLMSELGEQERGNVKEIILYGSVARGDARKDSDVDIFVNVYHPGSIEKRVGKIIEDFYKTAAFRNWKLAGIQNIISCITDNLQKWKDLKISIISDGIVLYSKYKEKSEGQQFVILYWDKIVPESKRVLISKKLYGYRTKKAVYKGLLETTGSIKLGPNTLFVDLDSAAKVIDVFKSNKITVKMIYASRLG